MFRKIRKMALRAAPSCKFSDKVVTKQGLSYTPAQIMEYQEKGIPVSAPGSESYFDGEANPTFDMPVDMLRGVDIVDCWVAQGDSRQRLISGHLTDVKNYG